MNDFNNYPLLWSKFVKENDEEQKNEVQMFRNFEFPANFSAVDFLFLCTYEKFCFSCVYTDKIKRIGEINICICGKFFIFSRMDIDMNDLKFLIFYQN